MHRRLYDWGFCIYLFVFVVSFGLNITACGWGSACDVDTSLPLLAALLMLIFSAAAVLFCLLWYWALACDDCCGLFGSKPMSTGQVGQASYQQNKGMRRFVLGKQMGYEPSQASQRYAPAMQPTVIGQPVPIRGTASGYPLSPVQGHPVDVNGQVAAPAKIQAMNGPFSAPAQPPCVPPPQSPPPPSAGDKAVHAAAQAAGIGLTLAGQGLFPGEQSKEQGLLFEGVLGLGPARNRSASVESEGDGLPAIASRSFPELAELGQLSLCFHRDGADGVLRYGSSAVPKRAVALSSVGKAHWALGFGGISIGGSTMPVQFCGGSSTASCTALPDSGTTLMMG
ncbi:unnamed protein product, partial [Polarella glacialis]